MSWRKASRSCRNRTRTGDVWTDRESNHVIPGTRGSMRLEDRPEPAPDSGTLLVQALALGVCGTDREIVAGAYGWAPPGRRAAGPRPRIARPRARGAAPAAASRPATWSSASSGGAIRSPACACAAGEWDMCRNGLYTERGIKAPRRLRRRALPPRARIRGEDRPGARSAAACCSSPRASSPKRGSISTASATYAQLDAAQRPGHRRRARRPAGRAHGRDSAAMRSMCSTAPTDGPKPELVRELGGTYHARWPAGRSARPTSCSNAPARRR